MYFYIRTQKGKDDCMESYEADRWQTQKATICKEYLIALQMILFACYEF